MKITLSARRSRGGTFLIQLLVYMPLALLITGLASVTFWKCFDIVRVQTRVGDEAVLLLRAGERWRDDLRRASLVEADSPSALRLTTPQGEIFWMFETNVLVRRVAGGEPGHVWARNLDEARFVPDPRGEVAAWRLEATLRRPSKGFRHGMGFTFLAVPRKEVAP